MDNTNLKEYYKQVKIINRNFLQYSRFVEWLNIASLQLNVNKNY